MQTFSIGRDANNQIVLNDNFVSRHHAQIIFMDNGRVLLKDLGSANGSFVNGNKVTEAYLNPGDVVKIGGSFVNWSQLVQQDSPYNQYTDSYLLNQRSTNNGQFSLGKVIGYLSIRVFDAGDLFKTNWNPTNAIIFFLLTPVVLSLGILLYIYSHIELNFFDFVVLPLIAIILLYGVSQFFTVSLLSITKNTSFQKNLLASSVYTFLQFGSFLAFLAIIKVVGFSYSFETVDFLVAKIFLSLIFYTLILCASVSLIIFLYKFFRSINASRSVSVHLTIIAFTLNSFVQALLIYLFIAIIKIPNIFDYA